MAGIAVTDRLRTRTQLATHGAAIELQAICKNYGDVAAVDDVSLSVAPGELLTLLGASGSGKTTLLRILAGFVSASSGSTLIDGLDVSRVPVHRRQFGMVFQDYALFPHLTVEKNVAFPLQMQRIPRRERLARVDEALDIVRLRGYERRLPRELSGGQQQRVALARAIVARPRLLLMDEPLGALDRRLRETMQVEIRRISHELGLTVVNVTHDQEEALSMSDRIALLADGKLVQFGRPADLYRKPINDIAATFLGESNLFRGPVVRRHGAVALDHPVGNIVVPESARSVPDGDETIVMVRPHAMSLEPDVLESEASVGEVTAGCLVRGKVISSSYAGDSWRVVVKAGDGQDLIVRLGPDEDHFHAEGDRVLVSWAPEQSVSMPPRS